MSTIDLLAEPSRGACRRIVAAGGKRLRPELVVATAFGGSTEHHGDMIDAAVAIELLHSATLIHDDFLDNSETRRGMPTVNAVEGSGAAIIAGDALVAQSFRLMARVGREAVEDLADAFSDMCSGQSLEDRLRYCRTAEPFEVLRVSQLKTGALIKAACRVGARIGGLEPDLVDALGIFGSDLGVALQLIDDILDLLSDASLLGKPCGADFTVGTVTMPAVFALASSSPGGQPGLGDLLRPGLTATEAELAQELLASSDGPARSIALARAFARRASRAVPEISPHYRDLAALPLRYVETQLRNKVSPRYQSLLSAGADSEPAGEVGMMISEMLEATA